MSALGSLLRLAVRGARARGPASVRALASTPRGKVFRERGGIPVAAAAVRAYARATGGDHLFAFYGEGAVAPPFFPATWEPALLLEMLAGVEPALPVGPVIHLSTETTWARPLRPGDEVRCRVALERVEPEARGIRLRVSARNWVGQGRLCSESTSDLLLRVPLPDLPRPDTRASAAPEEGWVEMVRWSLPSAAGRAYARVSGDYNPIHLWPLSARPFGFAAPILHGYATAARAAHTLVDLHLHGDPTALRRMRIAFRAPLELPATPSLYVAETGGERWFRVAAAGGHPIHAEGTFGAAAAP